MITRTVNGKNCAMYQTDSTPRCSSKKLRFIPLAARKRSRITDSPLTTATAALPVDIPGKHKKRVFRKGRSCTSLLKGSPLTLHCICLPNVEELRQEAAVPLPSLPQ